MITLRQLLIILAIYFAVRYFADNIEHFTSRDPVLDELRDQLSVLHPKFKNAEIYEGTKSFTVNKKKTYVCLRDSHGRYYSRNMLCYVILHEFSHVLCDEVGHTKKFFQIFDELLRKASSLGLYDPSIPPLDDYCGH